jgi:hypothetical protein
MQPPRPALAPNDWLATSSEAGDGADDASWPLAQLLPERPQTFIETKYNRLFLVDVRAPSHDFYAAIAPNGLAIVRTGTPLHPPQPPTPHHGTSPACMQG